MIRIFTIFMYLAKKCAVVAIILIVSFLSLCHRFIRSSPERLSIGLDDMPHNTEFINPKIWQFDPWVNKSVDGEWVSSWVTRNPDHAYNLMKMQDSNDYVRRQFRRDNVVLDTYLRLRSPALKSDLLRYLVLFAEGGVYSDLDTEVVKPIRNWAPNGVKHRVRAIVGIEYDQLEDPNMVAGMFYPLQFCQWTLASSRDHPLMRKMLKSVIRRLEELALERKESFEDLEPTQDEVLKTTGPAKWTEVIFDYLSERAHTRVFPSDLSGLQLPRLYGDILIMPINAFGTGLGHSNSSSFNTDATLIRHHFHSIWKHDLLANHLATLRPPAR